MHNYSWLKKHDVKNYKGKDFIRMDTLPLAFKEKLKLNQPDRSKVKCLHVCCYLNADYIEDDYFYNIVKDLL